MAGVMTVYVVVRNFPFEGYDSPERAFSTRTAAEAFQAELERKAHNMFDVEIFEMTVEVES